MSSHPRIEMISAQPGELPWANSCYSFHPAVKDFHGAVKTFNNHETLYLRGSKMDVKSRSDTLLSRWVSARGRAKSCWKSKARRRTTCSPNFFTAAVELPTWWTRLQASKCFCAYLYSRFGPVGWDQTLPGRMSGFGITTQIRYRSLELSNWRIPDYGISKLVERMVGGRQGW